MKRFIYITLLLCISVAGTVFAREYRNVAARWSVESQYEVAGVLGDEDVIGYGVNPMRKNFDSFVVHAAAEKESDGATTVPVAMNSGGGNPELVIGEKRVEPGVVFIFEGAVKDTIMPSSLHLSESQTHVHLEARANWDTKKIPEGTPAAGFVPYLHITAEVINQNNNALRTFVDLVPHVNLIDNAHYARNITLPGKISDLYTVVFHITPPALTELALHKDWTDMYGNQLLKQTTIRYKDVDFETIAKATRR